MSKLIVSYKTKNEKCAVDTFSNENLKFNLCKIFEKHIMNSKIIGIHVIDIKKCNSKDILQMIHENNSVKDFIISIVDNESGELLYDCNNFETLNQFDFYFVWSYMRDINIDMFFDKMEEISRMGKIPYMYDINTNNHEFATLISPKKYTKEKANAKFKLLVDLNS